VEKSAKGKNDPFALKVDHTGVYTLLSHKETPTQGSDITSQTKSQAASIARNLQTQVIERQVRIRRSSY